MVGFSSLSVPHTSQRKVFHMIVCPVAGLAYHRAVEFPYYSATSLVGASLDLWIDDLAFYEPAYWPALAFRFVTNSLLVTNAGGASSISCRPKVRG